MCLMPYANNKSADQPSHPRSLISAFIVRCLDSVMSLVSVTKISSLMLASVAEQASLSLTWSETPEDIFLWRGSYILPTYIFSENTCISLSRGVTPVILWSDAHHFVVTPVIL